MTTYQEFMLSICFGVCMAFVLFGWGYNIVCLVRFIKDKVKAHKEKKNQQSTEDNEKVGESK